MDAQVDSTAAERLHESPIQEQARLRRERRNAKIQAGGSARLDAISRLNGRAAASGEDGKPREVQSDTRDAAEAHPVDDPPMVLPSMDECRLDNTRRALFGEFMCDYVS